MKGGRAARQNEIARAAIASSRSSPGNEGLSARRQKVDGWRLTACGGRVLTQYIPGPPSIVFTPLSQLPVAVVN